MCPGHYLEVSAVQLDFREPGVLGRRQDQLYFGDSVACR